MLFNCISLIYTITSGALLFTQESLFLKRSCKFFLYQQLLKAAMYRVLVVDDDKTCLNLLKACLEKWNYQGNFSNLNFYIYAKILFSNLYVCFLFHFFKSYFLHIWFTMHAGMFIVYLDVCVDIIRLYWVIYLTDELFTDLGIKIGM